MQLTNQAIHLSINLLDLFASKTLDPRFNVRLATLASLLTSAKFIQMRYPSADSLNAISENAFDFDTIVAYEKYFLETIDWQLMQYTYYDYVNLYLNQGCLYETDIELGSHSYLDKRVSEQMTENLRTYADFFSDFCSQESDLVGKQP